MHQQDTNVISESFYNILSVPEQSDKIVKASFAGCPISDRKLFSQSKCILPISIMGRKEHEGNRFQATMKLINNSFESCALIIVDSLYRHTLKIDHPNESTTVLYNKAKEAGTSWLERNINAYSQLSIPYKIIRWNEYLNNPKFSQQYTIVSDLYNKDMQYKQSIDDSVKEYLKRQLNNKNIVNFNYEEASECCINYLIEECAAMCLYGEYEFEVYPTGRTTALAVTYERFIQPFYPNLLRPVAIRFKK